MPSMHEVHWLLLIFDSFIPSSLAYSTGKYHLCDLLFVIEKHLLCLIVDRSPTRQDNNIINNKDNNNKQQYKRACVSVGVTAINNNIVSVLFRVTPTHSQESIVFFFGADSYFWSSPVQYEPYPKK
jgi:hypothetical protein